MPTVLITGANRGLGLEFVRRYAADGWRVIATCRNPLGLDDLAQAQGNIEIHGLDVTDARQVDKLAQDMDGQGIDILINNAGIYGPRTNSPTDFDASQWAQVFDVNVMAPLKVAGAFLPHLSLSKFAKIIAISSKMESMHDNTSGGSYIYRSSKAALNAVMKSLSIDVLEKNIAVAVLHPGWVQTDMGGPSALIDAKTSVAGMHKVIDGLTIDETGHFYNYDGAPVPW